MRDIIRINNLDNAEELLWNHNKEIGRTLSDDELLAGIKKFLTQGEILGIVENNRIIAMLNLYCNNYDTLEAYICNVYVVKECRGNNISQQMMEKAIKICQQREFKSIHLHVSENNIPAVKTYLKLGFVFADGYREEDREMVLKLEG